MMLGVRKNNEPSHIGVKPERDGSFSCFEDLLVVKQLA